MKTEKIYLYIKSSLKNCKLTEYGKQVAGKKVTVKNTSESVTFVTFLEYMLIVRYLVLPA
jgi:hypothetical protein